MSEKIKSLVFFKFALLILISQTLSNEIILTCTIDKEIENNKPTDKKNYKEKELIIFLNKQEKWINDISKNEWDKQFHDDRDKVETVFREDKKIYNFIYKSYYSDFKQKLESSFKLTLEKLTGFLVFIKYYYDINNDIFFTSEISGQCFKKQNY